MFSAEVREMLVEVIRSWQVWVVTIALLIYITIVRKVANLQAIGTRRKAPKKRRLKKEKTEVPEPSADDDLGLEEEGAGDSQDPDEEYVE